MTEEKMYIIGYNRYSQQMIVYSTVKDAERSGTWWKEVRGLTLEDAKELFMTLYHAEN